MSTKAWLYCVIIVVIKHSGDKAYDKYKWVQMCRHLWRDDNDESFEYIVWLRCTNLVLLDVFADGAVVHKENFQNLCNFNFIFIIVFLLKVMNFFFKQT